MCSCNGSMVKCRAILFFIIYVQDRHLDDFITSIFKAGVWSDALGPVSFKPVALIDTTELYSMKPVLMTFVFIQGHRALRKPVSTINHSLCRSK